MIQLPVHGLPLFATAALLVNLTPGPDMLFVASNAAAHGRRAGVAAALGVGAGCLLHVMLAAVGLSALLATSALAFSVVKWAGAAYLVWIGASMLLRRAAPPLSAGSAPTTASGTQLFWQGALTNALNPKVAIFFLAFLPQFIEPGANGQGWAFVALGLLFDVGGTVVNLVVALLAGTLGRRRAGSPGAARSSIWLQRAAGALFIALGLKLALGSRWAPLA